MHSLARITQHVATNKMTPYNLRYYNLLYYNNNNNKLTCLFSIVFGPHVLKKRESDPVSELNDSKIIYDIIQLMIEEHDAIFSVNIFKSNNNLKENMLILASGSCCRARGYQEAASSTTSKSL